MPVFCNACELLLGIEWEDIPPGPCSKCGFETRVWYPPRKEFDLRVVRHRSRSHAPGGGRWVYQGEDRESLFTANGRLHLVERTIDRIRGEYHERIVDKETGQLVREIHEPLEEHRGRGSAKKKENGSEPKGGAA